MMHTRDPFARHELHSEREYEPAGTCAWCGQVRETRGGRPWLYRFRIETDGGRKFEAAKLFCSRSCHTSYNS
jgi:hypothetical protein